MRPMQSITHMVGCISLHHLHVKLYVRVRPVRSIRMVRWTSLTLEEVSASFFVNFFQRKPACMHEGCTSTHAAIGTSFLCLCVNALVRVKATRVFRPCNMGLLLVCCMCEHVCVDEYHARIWKLQCSLCVCVCVRACVRACACVCVNEHSYMDEDYARIQEPWARPHA